MNKSLIVLALILGVVLSVYITKKSLMIEKEDSSTRHAPLIIDVTGKIVGRVVPVYSAYVGVLINSGGNSFILPLSFHENGEVSSTGLNWLTSNKLYESPNCSGQAFILILDGAFGGDRLANVTKQGDKYVANIASEGPIRHGRFNSVDAGDDRGCRSSTEKGPAVPIMATISLDNYGVAPFRIR